jgi:hypothetical protein
MHVHVRSIAEQLGLYTILICMFGPLRMERRNIMLQILYMYIHVTLYDSYDSALIPKSLVKRFVLIFDLPESH